jgi:hypothetical protein
MSRNLTDAESQLYSRCDEVLHYIWDPIGVAGSPFARDEYESYVPSVFSLLHRGADAKTIAEHLTKMATESMGLRAACDQDRKVAEILLEWRQAYSQGAA